MIAELPHERKHCASQDKVGCMFMDEKQSSIINQSINNAINFALFSIGYSKIAFEIELNRLIIK